MSSFVNGFGILLAASALGGCHASTGDHGGDRPEGGVHPALKDGGSDAGLQAEVICRVLPPVSSGVCEVIAGGGEGLLLQGVVLAPGTLYRGGQVAIDAKGLITCVGCDCDGGATSPKTVNCPAGVISPGLINTHDHLTFAQNSPHEDTGERFEQRHDWRLGLRGHTAIPSKGDATPDQIRWGELRFLLGGATTTVGSGSVGGFLRNLDDLGNEGGLGRKAVHLDTFPLGDSSGIQLESGCAYPAIRTSADVALDDSYEPHLAEGIDSAARNEFSCASSIANGGQDLMLPQTAVIHAVALGAADYGRMASTGTSLVWSPRSNIALYGDTARVTVAARVGVEIALGTDWIDTGSMNVLRELSCADFLNSVYLDHFFADEELFRMVTSSAAAAAGVGDALGSLRVSYHADIAIFDASKQTDYRAVIDGAPAGVSLVLRDGKALFGDDGVVAALAQDCDPLDVCGTAKRVCATSEIGESLGDLQSAVSGGYDAFFCGVPDHEPSCVPTRPNSVDGSSVYTGMPTATDADGDGVADGADDCPRVFNPVRPMDDGAQADADGDGIGDVCDSRPLDAG
jgi:cytosine/adenosine deaminase-related metal-dependent hydrolase